MANSGLSQKKASNQFKMNGSFYRNYVTLF